MNQWKQNISRWHALGFAAVLLIACLVLATGTAWARYRTEFEGDISFRARAPVAVHLGKMDTETDEFTTTGTNSWEMVDGRLQLDFAVANGLDDASYEEATQEFCIRLVSSLGMWTDAAPATIKLIDPEEHDLEAEEDAGYTGKPIRITENSLLYNSFGDGWVYHFLDDKGEELTWTLEGGAFSCVDLDLVVILEEDQQIDTSLLQLQVVGEKID